MPVVERLIHARQYIGTGVADLAAQARRLLIEALIGLENWPEAAREVNDWAHGPDGPRLQVGEVVDLIHNAGLAAATQVLIGRSEPAEVLDALLSWPDIAEVLQAAVPGERNRIALLTVIRDKAHGLPIEQGRRDELARADLSSPYGKDEGWGLLRQLVLPTPAVFTDAD